MPAEAGIQDLHGVARDAREPLYELDSGFRRNDEKNKKAARAAFSKKNRIGNYADFRISASYFCRNCSLVSA